ncbi:hypothetical protein D8674_027229 [Pyrus ussuriensis x Pyrus communis]|uniref:Uncharacterized protein n=1 Tax=Pyrus ussuriensis x Pyrus communis TaxID=2448454 RepID=A0A5N5I968_9ROSA|nr:hypothetical protein D8674_027229 [Pyrus ussuriensis x Pyrus communis]
MRFRNVIFTVTTVVFLMSMNMHEASAGRVLHDVNGNSVSMMMTMSKDIMLTESKQKSNHPPPGGPNPKVPAMSNDLDGSMINQRNFAGHTTTPPSPHDAYPHNVVARSLLGVATDHKSFS